MEKRFAISIMIHLYPDREEFAPQLSAQTFDTDHPIAAFLYDIAGNSRRFRVESAGLDHAEVSGACTEAELSVLSAQMKEFFEVYGLNYGLNHWKITRGDRVPEFRELFEDGALPVPQVALTLTFLQEWADAEQTPPVQAFFALLEEKLAWGFSPPPQAAAHIAVVFPTDIPVWRIWDAGQAVLKELKAATYLIEFAVRENEKNHEVYEGTEPDGQAAKPFEDNAW